jgi:hypothetical protein
MIRRVPRSARDPRLLAALAVLVGGGVVLRGALGVVGEAVVAGDEVRGIWTGVVLAGVAWVPSVAALVRRTRWGGDDRWFHVSVVWGALVVLVGVLPGRATDPAVIGPASSWLLVATVVLWTTVTYLLTRRRTRA